MLKLAHIRETALLPRRTPSFKVQQPPQEDKKRHGNWHKTPRFSAYDPSKVAAWLTHNLVLDQTATIPKIKLFTAYSEWCQSLGLRVMSSNIFGKFLFKLFPTVKSCRPGQAGRQVTHYRGIAWSHSSTTTMACVSPVPSPRSSNPSSPSSDFFDDIGCQGDSSSPSSPFSSLTASPVDLAFLPSSSPSPLSPQPYVFSPFCCKPTPHSPEEFNLGYREKNQATSTRKMSQTSPASVTPVLPPLALPPFKPASLPHNQPTSTSFRLPPVSSLFSASFNPTADAPPLTPLRLSQEQYAFKPILRASENMPSLIDVDESYRQTPSPVTAPSRLHSPSTIRTALREKAGEDWEFGALEDLLRDCHGLLNVRFKGVTAIQYENLPYALNRAPKTTLISALWLYGEALKHGNAQDAQYHYLVCLNSLLQENTTWEILCASYVLEETCDLWFTPECAKIIKDHLLLVAQGANPSKALTELKALKYCTEFYLGCTGAQA